MRAGIKLLIVCSAMILCMTGTTGATVINFDELTNPYTGGAPSGDSLAAGYQGFDWTSWRVWGNYSESWPTAPSPGNVATNFCDGGNVEISSGTAFDFNGAYFSRLYATDSSSSRWSATTITIEGYNGGSLIGTRQVALAGDGSYGWEELDLLGIDRLVFTPMNAGSEFPGGWFGMDNFTFDEPGSPVPEPATLALLGLGLAALALYGKKAKG